MLKATTDVIRLALLHDIRRHERALDHLNGHTLATTKAGDGHRADMSDLRAALADLDAEEVRVDAVAALLAVVVDWADRPQGHFTGREAEVFARLLDAYGRSTSAAVFLQTHRPDRPLTRSA